MMKLPHLFLLLFLCSFTMLSFAQDDESKKYRKKDLEQLEAYEEGDYLFPPQPKNNLSIGVKGGSAFVFGDVSPQLGLAGAIDIRKALGHVFSLRLQASYSQARGQNFKPSRGYIGGINLGNPWADVYYANRTSVTDGTPTPPQVFYNFQMRAVDVALQGVVSLNNINFYKEASQWNIFAAAGIGMMGYVTKVDARGADNSFYNHFDVVANTPLGNTGNLNVSGRRQRLDDLASAQDGVYESLAEGSGDPNGFTVNGDPIVFNPALTGALGVRYKLGRRLELELEYRIAWSNDDLLDGQRWQEGAVALTRDFDNYSQATLGIHFRLGKGEDGLWWVNPLTDVYSSAKEANRMVQELTNDTDKDGVPDLYDKEPDTPENTPVDRQGRTLDSDGDGYPDIEDDEPFSMKGCPVDANGVMIDADNDGTPDCVDKEPNSPPGMYYDANGVAIVIDTEGGSGEMPCLLPIVHFDLDKDIIKPEFYPELYYIAQVMQADPDLKVRAIGHTDNRNSDAYNEDLSKRRVENAVNFIVTTYGISRDRFVAGHSGEGDPVIKNLPDNRSNRKLEPLHYVNRRVEFECVTE